MAKEKCPACGREPSKPTTVNDVAIAAVIAIGMAATMHLTLGKWCAQIAI